MLNIGDRKISDPNDVYVDIRIPEEFLIYDFNESIKANLIITYLNLINNYKINFKVEKSWLL